MRGEDIFEDLDSTQTDELWRPEFASYMLEGTPGQPYGSTLKDLLKVEKVRVTITVNYCGSDIGRHTQMNFGIHGLVY